MAVDLKIGENVSVPPAGYKRLKVNADGTGALLDPDGTESEIGGGGGAVETIVAGDGISVDATDPANPIITNSGVAAIVAGAGVSIDDADPAAPVVSTSTIAPWFRNVAEFIQGLQPTLLVATLATDCVQTGAELDVQAAVGTGTCAPVTTLAGGVIRTASGATANSYRILKNRGGATSPTVSNTRTSKYAAAVRCKVVATAATFAIDLCGFTDEATFATAIEAFSTISAVNYVLKVGSHAGQNTGVPFVVGTWVTLILNADGTNVTAYLAAADGTSPVIMGVAQAQVTAPTAAGAWLFNAQNLGTAANVSADIDCALVLTERAS